VTATVEELRRRLPVSAIVVYGSQVEGRADQWSDVDIAVFSPAVETMSLDDELDLLYEVHEAVGHDIDIRLFSDRSLEEAATRPASFVAHILKTGKRVA